MELRFHLRRIGNAINLSTPFGLLAARIGGARVSAGPRGLLLAEGYRLGFPYAAAFTVGNVLIARDSWDEQVRRNPRLLEHEEGHTWQWLNCLGLPFLLAYSACLGWSMLRTGDRALGNFFERQAGLESGGYLPEPVD
ncbi:hypothetical protein [Microlunatus parietis]|uniref:DUF4157 domain-containing protein n=1 Tax=Microlunatus parietis TaxID=682979 RepID=A0A7Y9IB98_9ACTN|nr:hypothetical protein [Microlunatus parietis]NYE73401.1 hypothetical protein [Microlunatus parietis]